MLKQPRMLFLLCFTEMWERFGFYTLQTIIILYMTHGLHMSDTKANMQYAAFNSLLYLTPVLGGFIADRYLGFQKAISCGGLLFIIGYLLSAGNNDHLFFLGLSFIICGNGFFKPNVSSIVGELYKKNDSRRDGGFTLFYMGINLGALIPPLIAGWLVTQYGWHSGFYLAAIGMLIGQVTFFIGKNKLQHIGRYPMHTQNTLHVKFIFRLIIGSLGFIGLTQFAFVFPEYTNRIITCGSIAAFIFVSRLILKEPKANRNNLFASLILIIISVGFWAIYNQTGTSLMLFADRNMQKSLGGFAINAEFMQFFNPLFIIMLSPLLSKLWIRLDHFNLNPSIQLKFVLSVLMMSAGFIILSLGSHYFHVHGLVSAWWLVLSYFLQTVGELLISPIGLAMITVLCPKHLVGMMMGVWFLAQAASFAVGGLLANVAAIPTNLSTVASLPIYTHAFWVYGNMCLGMTLVSLLLIPFLNKLIKDAEGVTSVGNFSEMKPNKLSA